MQFVTKKHNTGFLHNSYFVLAAGLSLGATAYFILIGQPVFQGCAIIITGMFYILWGAIHHAHEGDFHLSILLEYTLVAGLAVALLLSLLFRL